MELHPKPPEQIEAEIATFATEGLEHDRDTNAVFEQIDYAADGTVTEVSRPTESADRLLAAKELGGYAMMSSVELKATQVAATKEQYAEWMRRHSSDYSRDITRRRGLLEGFQPYAEQVGQLKQDIAAASDHQQLPAHLGTGGNSSVFTLPGREDLVVRVGKNESTQGTQHAKAMDMTAVAMAAGRGIHGLEQIQGMSYREGVTVSERVPGHDGDHLTSDDFAAVTDKQLAEMATTITEASKAGIVFDTSKDSNFLYDKEAGFTAIDYGLVRSGAHGMDAPKYKVMGFTRLLAYGGTEYSRPKQTAAEYAREAEELAVRLPVAERFADIYAQMAPEDTEGIAEQTKLIAAARTAIENGADSEWVAHELAERNRPRNLDDAPDIL